MAASILATLPIAIIYVFFQRYFVAGVVASGGEGMMPSRSLQAPMRTLPLHDFCDQSWRLVLLNTRSRCRSRVLVAASPIRCSRSCSCLLLGLLAIALTHCA